MLLCKVGGVGHLVYDHFRGPCFLCIFICRNPPTYWATLDAPSTIQHTVTTYYPPLFHVSMYRLSHCLAPFTRSCASALPPSPAPAARIEYGLLYSAFRPTLFKHIALASSETCMYVDCRNIRTQHDLVLLDELRLRDPLVGVSCSCGRVSWRCIACMRWHMYRIAVGPVGPTPSGRVCE